MPCPRHSRPRRFSQENSDKANLDELQSTGTSLLERIRFREQRFYWLYVAAGAIITLLYKEQGNTARYEFVYYMGLILIQCLVIGIGWNYYANDIKIDKYVAMRTRIYKELGAREVPIDEGGMKHYRCIYAFFEYCALIFPSILACLLVMRPGLFITGSSQLPHADCVLPLLQIASGVLLFVTLQFFWVMSFWRKSIFRREDDKEEANCCHGTCGRCCTCCRCTCHGRCCASCCWRYTPFLRK